MKFIRTLAIMLMLASMGLYCGGGGGGASGQGGPEMSPADLGAGDVVASDSTTSEDKVPVDADNSSLGLDEVGLGDLPGENLGDPDGTQPGDTVLTTGSGDSGSGDTGSGDSGTVGTGGSGSGDSGTVGTGGSGSGDSGTVGTGGSGSGDSGTVGSGGSGSGDSGITAGDGTDDDLNNGGVSTGRTITLDSSQGKWYETPKGSLVADSEYQAALNQIKELHGKIKEAKGNQGKNEDKGKGNDDKVTGQDKKIDEKALKEELKALKSKIKALRDKVGFSNKQSGIHTYWANQNLYLQVRNNDKAGWYKLIVVAKNYNGADSGFKLPEDYKFFNLTVRNETTGKSLGGIHIKASDIRYNRGKLLVYLPAGNTDFNILWTNDSYTPDKKWDANIQIKRVALKFHGEQLKTKKRLMRKAHQYSYVEGTWYWDNNTVRTYWANQTIGFEFNNIAAGKYEVTLVAKNYGKVPPKYTAFNVTVESDDNATAKISVPADENKFQKGKTVIDLTGPTTLYFTWTNDMYKPEIGCDANIQIKKVILKKVGDSNRSPMAAYLIAKATKNKVPVAVLFATVAIALGSLFVWNRRKMKANG